MELFFPIAIFVVGILVMFRVISIRKSGRYLVWIGLAFVFGPVFYCMARTKAIQFISGSHHWWEYVLGFFIVLILLRLLLNFIFPNRRR